MENRTCKDCGAVFTINEKEAKYYRKRGLFLPKRCSICREYRYIEKMRARENREPIPKGPIPGAPVRKENSMNDPIYRCMFCVTPGIVEEPV